MIKYSQSIRLLRQLLCQLAEIEDAGFRGNIARMEDFLYYVDIEEGEIRSPPEDFNIIQDDNPEKKKKGPQVDEGIF